MIKFLMAIWHPGPYFVVALFLSLANIINIHIPWYFCIAPIVVWGLIIIGIVAGFLLTIYNAIIKPIRKFMGKK